MKQTPTRVVYGPYGQPSIVPTAQTDSTSSRSFDRSVVSWATAALCVALVSAVGGPVAQAGCGHVGERACCLFEKDFGACRDDLVQRGNCGDLLGDGNCDCSDNPNNCCDADGASSPPDSAPYSVRAAS